MGHEMKQTHGRFSMNSTTVTRNNTYQTKIGKIKIKKINPTYKWMWKATNKAVESEMKHFEH